MSGQLRYIGDEAGQLAEIHRAHGFVPLGDITVRFDRVYGRITCYPVCARACTLATLAKQTTLTPREIRLARELGFTVRLASGSLALLEDFVAGRS